MVLYLGVSCSSSVTDPPSTGEPPNLILIMADDLGYNDLECYGNQTITTPNIDKLASGGTKFLDYHSNGVVCSPTRAALLTGRYQQRSGIEAVVTAKHHRQTGFRDHLTLAQFLRESGYHTAIIGKWHLGYDTLFSPLNNGFDYFKGFVSGNIDYHSHIDQEGYYDWWLNKDTLQESGYSTDLITNSALAFISEHRNDPFFLYIAHEAPHYPYQGRKDSADRNVDGVFDVKGSRTDREGAYEEMMMALDEGIGQLLVQLEKFGLLENTLLFFCSDNGAVQPGSNAPLKGYKGNVWEGGHRVPAIAYWRSKALPQEIDQPILSMDIFPTVVDLVGNPSNIDLPEFDGQSFLGLLESKKTVLEDRDLFWRFGPHKKAVRSNSWKYIMHQEDEYLYNLAEDLEEEFNLIDSFPEKTADLRSKLDRWEVEMSRYENLTD